MTGARAEREILRIRPSWLAAAAVFAPFLVPALFLLVSWAVLKYLLRNDFPPALVISVFMIGVSLFFGVLLRLSRTYTLTTRRITAKAGIFSRAHGEVPLRNVQHITVTRGLVEVLTGTGTVSVSSAGSGGVTLSWLMVPDPESVLAAVRAAVDEAQGEAPPKIPVIGLVGGIGAGKSAVAKLLGSMGCLVIDADADAREVLARPSVVARLVEWWGTSVLDPAGKIDRKKVGEIVFADPAERRRLEELVHPLVKADRDAVVDRARDQGLAGVVIDAPLLFEAGSDADCDAVMFVDAPREVREARVKSRGWAPEELSRREAAQWPLERKRASSDFVVTNDGDLAGLEARVREAFEGVRGRLAKGQGRRGA